MASIAENVVTAMPTDKPTVKPTGKRSRARISKNKKSANCNVQVKLPEQFASINPNTTTTDALPLFRCYLVLLDLTTSSIGTYYSCANNWTNSWAANLPLKLAFHPDYIKLTKGKSDKGSLKRAFPMTRCGLGHFVRMYELCCQQYHPNIDPIFEKGAKVRNQNKRIVFENTLTLQEKMIDKFTIEFILDFKQLPTTPEEMKVYLKSYSKFVQRKTNERVWELSGVSKGKLWANMEEKSD